MERKNFLKGLASFAGLSLLSNPLFKGFSKQIRKKIFGKNSGVQNAPLYRSPARDGFTKIVDGKYEEAEQYYKYLLENYASVYSAHTDEFPTDLEALYCLTLIYAGMGNAKKALEHAKRAVKEGLPFERFLVGPRDLTAPLFEIEEFMQWADQQDIELLHGPMLSNVTEFSAEFWVRTVHAVPVNVKLSAQESMESSHMLHGATTGESRDYTAVISTQQLKPDTKYYYQLVINGKLHPGKWSFRTYPKSAKPAQFQIGFGGCSGYTPWYERMWNTVAGHDLLAFICMGDNVYHKHPKYPDVQRYCYYRRQSRPEFQNFTAGSAIYSIWSDADFGPNNSYGGPEKYSPAWKTEVLQIFKENWNNPYYAGGEPQPGIWFSFSIADVDFFAIDCRYYRTSPDVEQPSMLGPDQKQWLYKKLKDSDATFKVIVSDVPWAYDSKLGPASYDTWKAYYEERNEIFSFLAQQKIEGVVLLAGDRHRAEIRKIRYKGIYDLYSFENCKLTNVHTAPCVGGSLFCYNEKNVFGRLQLDTTKKDPELIYDIYNIDNEQVFSYTMKKSQLMFS